MYVKTSHLLWMGGFFGVGGVGVGWGWVVRGSRGAGCQVVRGLRTDNLESARVCP